MEQLLKDMIQVLWWVIACLGLIVSVMLLLLLIKSIWMVLVSTTYKVKPENCNHKNSQYDEGHPEYPFKCDDCGYRQ